MKWLLAIVGAVIAVIAIAFLIFRTPDTDPAEMRAKYGAAPSQFIEIGGGVTVHLRDEGPDDAPPIMLLHGSNADLHTWRPWAEALSDDFRVIRFDQIGHGLTGPDPRADYSRGNFVDDIREVADAIGLEKFIIGGSSMGGKHALAFASRYPERVRGLVLVGSSGAPMEARADHADTNAQDDDEAGNIGFAIAQMPGINRLVTEVTPRFLIEQSLEDTVAVKDILTDEMIDRYWELLRYPGNRAATIERFSSGYDALSRAQVAAIDAPALILHGAQDGLIPASAGRWLDETLPNSRFVVYPGIGHLPHEEASQQTVAELENWLSETILTLSAE